ncbi:MAG: YdcF family protein [Alphaproteobacteria bacterium]|nr:YdcF family protein [Alphaproteobacteria bacterium]
MSFVISKIFWVFTSPGNVLVLLLMLGAFLSVAQGERWRRFGRRLCFVVAFLFFLIAICPVGDWMLTPLENRFPPAKLAQVDGIVLLGEDEKPFLSAARGQPVAYTSASDYVHFVTLARAYPKARLVFAGGSGLLVPDPRLKDAEVAKQALAGLGLAVDRVVFEDESRNTYENAVKAVALVKPRPEQKWLLVASARHMPRAMACFRKAGWNTHAAPAAFMTDGKYASKLQFSFADHLFRMNMAMHEYLGLLAYRLMGYTDELWPR